MTIKKEDCEKVILTASEMSLLKSTDDATAYRVGNEYYDFEFTDEESPFGSKFVISERAWTIKKPRTKTEFVQQGFHKCHEAMFKHEMEEELYISSHNGFVVASMSNIIDNWRAGLYRKVETEIDERQEFIGVYKNLASVSMPLSIDGWAGLMFDSGKFKLVE